MLYSLQDNVLDFILNSQNPKEALGHFWKMGDMIPNMIRKREKVGHLNKILYSFNRTILLEVWGCPEDMVEKYQNDTKLEKYLDKIIYGDHDILSLPSAIIDLLDKRDKEICDTTKYKTHFCSEYEDCEMYEFDSECELDSDDEDYQDLYDHSVYYHEDESLYM